MSAQQQPASKLIGQVLGNRYQILERLGEGAMGAVYKARHVRVGRPFAVKVLHPRLLADEKVAMRFEREAELAGRLRHANVVGVVDVGEVEGTRYMVMDFAEGPDLAQLLVEAPMPPQRIIHLTRQMLEGLYHAHERGLIHRDFKPENVIIERDTHGAEMPRIVDFGIAILRDAGEGVDGQGRLTTNGLVLGTPHYMAPEQAVADPIDHRIDLFALGIVIYEMLSGRLPFDGNGAEVARANLLLDPPPIVQRVPYLEVDPLLEAFSRRLMSKKRGDRPATANAARELLDLIERDRPAAAAALGLAVDRAPAVTQSVDPQEAGGYAGTSAEPTAQMKPTPVPAQPATAEPGAIASPFNMPGAMVFSAPHVRELQPRHRTSIRTPLSWETASLSRSRRPWLIVTAVLGAAVIAAAVLLVVAGEPEAPPPGDRVVMTPIAPAPRAPVPATPVVAVDDSHAIAPTSPAPAEPESTVEVEPVAMTSDHGEPARATVPRRSAVDPRMRAPARVEPRPAAAETRPPPVTRPAVVETRPSSVEPAPPSTVDTKPDPPANRPAETIARRPGAAPEGDQSATIRDIRPEAMAGITPGAIAKLFYSIPPQLNQLVDVEAQDLRERLRLFDIQKLMIGPQADRDRAAPQLAQILNDALTRKARSAAPRSDKSTPRSATP